MAQPVIYKRKKRGVVQLTALLDLLFIMVFIGLLTPYAPGGTETEKTTQTTETSKKKPTEKRIAREKLLKEIAKSSSDKHGLNAKLTKLFTANMYYERDGHRKTYRETALWAADTKVGLVRFRIKLAKNTSVIRTGRSDPLNLRDGQPIADCTLLSLNRDRIFQECKMPFERRIKIDCSRLNAKRYKCTEELDQTPNSPQSQWKWVYELELIQIYDDRVAY